MDSPGVGAVRPGTVGPTAAAIVLTGGQSRRMGTHKPALLVGGRPLVQIVLDAVHLLAPPPVPTVVVGSAQAVPPGVRVVREEPPGGGPVAAVARGVQELRRFSVRAETPVHQGNCVPSGVREGGVEREGEGGIELVFVLAADLPRITPGLLTRLAERVGAGAPVAVARTSDGALNWLCAAWSVPVLRAQLAGLEGRGGVDGASMRALVAGVDVGAVDDGEDRAVDVDTPQQLAALAQPEVGESDGVGTGPVH